jgi:NitT/TauT family transport system ATP-binding protein
MNAAATRATSTTGVIPPMLEARSLEKTYPNGLRALERVDLTVRTREFVTLLGPSGCGKSTLLKIIAGLSAPTGGSVQWSGNEVEAVDVPRRSVAMVFQEPTLMPWARVDKNVRLPLTLARVPGTHAERAVAQALTLVDLANFAKSYPRELSGGMQMRVSIARALVTEPNLLLMDEPFGALDEITRNRLDTDLLRLWSAQQLTVIFVTHSIHEAVFLSTRVAVLSARPGRILREVFIDEPFPRDAAFRVSQRFAAYCERLSELLIMASLEGTPNL